MRERSVGISQQVSKANSKAAPCRPSLRSPFLRTDVASRSLPPDKLVYGTPIRCERSLAWEAWQVTREPPAFWLGVTRSSLLQRKGSEFGARRRGRKSPRRRRT